MQQYIILQRETRHTAQDITLPCLHRVQKYLIYIIIQLFLKTTMEMYNIIFGNVKELMYTTTSRDNYGNMYVWKCQRMNIHCNIKRQLWKYICLEISKNGCTLLFQEITLEMYMFGNIKNGCTLLFQEIIMEMYMFGNIKKRMFTAISRNNYGNVYVWKYQRTEIHCNFKRQLWKHQRMDI